MKVEDENTEKTEGEDYTTKKTEPVEDTLVEQEEQP